MPIKAVVIQELKVGTSKNGEYQIAFDQTHTRWNIFSPMPKVELNKSYAFHFEEENGYANLKKIEPIVDLFLRKALVEVANRNDYAKQIGIAVSYAKDLASNNVIKLEEIFIWADKIYDYINQKADREMPKEELVK